MNVDQCTGCLLGASAGVEFAIRVRGDVDTIGAMFGAVWGARRGTPELPNDWLEQLEAKDRVERTGAELFERAQGFRQHR